MSFRRRSSKATALPDGVASSAGGSRIVSSGIRGLDTLLGGGIPLGKLTVLIEDSPTFFHSSVLASFCAQGVAHRHAVAYASATAPAAHVLSALPAPSRDVTSGPSVTPPTLDIAWRYAAAPRRAASTRGDAKFRIELDASTPTAPGPDAPLSALGFPDTRVSALVAGVRAHCTRARRGGDVARVAVAGLATEFWEWDAEIADMHSALARLRDAVRGTDAALLVSVASTVVTAEIAVTADAVVRMNAFERDGGRWMGTAVVEKAANVAPGRWLGVRGSVFVFRRARRGLVFEEAAIEPDDAEKVAGNGKGGVEKGPGRVCGTGPGNAALDF